MTEQEAKPEQQPLLQQIELRPVRSQGDLLTLDKSGGYPDNSSILREQPGLFRGRGLFLATFVMPVFLSAIYLFLIASDIYVSEARFIIRTPAASPGADGVFSSVAVSQGMMRATEETAAVNEYILSRDALDVLLSKANIREMFHRPEADFINRFPNFYTKDNKEMLFKYYRKMVHAWIDYDSSISVVSVMAFRPEDAMAIAQRLLAAAEGLVNRLNQRANEDALAYANAIVDQAKGKLLDAEKKLTDYRNKAGMIDPSSETTAAMSSITQLSTELSRFEANLREREALAPLSPALDSLREKIRAQRDEVDRQRARLVGGNISIASTLAGFEQLSLDREMASRALASAEANRERARQDAERQHLYLQTVVEPHLPDQATYPRRFLYFTLCVFAAAGLFYAAKSIKEIIEDHAL